MTYLPMISVVLCLIYSNNRIKGYIFTDGE